ncbi:MAG: hypothetical protein KGL63_06035 [Betaproteobacteria bacterium]|nr:hypothetical protein [Betaproteobacteria bacterium]
MPRPRNMLYAATAAERAATCYRYGRSADRFCSHILGVPVKQCHHHHNDDY